MKKKFFALLIFMLLLALSTRPAVWAATVDSGSCGDNLTWTLDSNGTLTISGDGAMWDYENFGGAPWRNYNLSNKIKSIVIDNGVTSIGSKAFFNLEQLEEVEISDTVYTIGSDAFNSCTNLKSITIPSSVNAISQNTFHDCSNLSEITIENGVKYIENQAFYGCNLSVVNIPESIIRIEDHAFRNCSSLTEINVAARNIQYSSHNGSLYNKEKSKLLICPPGKTTFEIHPETTDIDYLAFGDCAALQQITLSDNINTLPTFFYCTSLKEFKIPNNITRLYQTFNNCTSLERVYIPASIKTIQADTFSRCYNLKEIIYSGTQEQWDSIRIDDGNAELSNATIVCLGNDEPTEPENPDKPTTPTEPENPDKPTTPTEPETPNKPTPPTTPDTPGALPITAKPGGLGSKLTVRVSGGHWLTIQVRRAGSIAITSVQAPGHGTVEITFSAAAGSTVQVWETEQEMMFTNGVPDNKILSVSVKTV